MPTVRWKPLSHLGRLRWSKLTFPALVVWGLVTLVLLLLILPKLLVWWDIGSSEISPADRSTAIGTARTTLIQGIAVALVGAFFAWRQAQTTREEQVTERFNTAISHLGSDQLDVRLGGIYALERIARGSPVDRDGIAEILTAYVRIRSPKSSSEEDSELSMREQTPLRLRAPDVQVALIVLGRGNFAQIQSQSLDLRDTNLTGADLIDAQLRRANFSGADLKGANLSGADLMEANLSRANLRGANLSDTILLSADLTFANLQRAQLFRAQLQMARLIAADLTGANFFGADLEAASLSNANLMGTVLDEANLTGTGLQKLDPEAPA